jgi:hypothetical protein
MEIFIYFFAGPRSDLGVNANGDLFIFEKKKIYHFFRMIASGVTI